MASLIVLNTKMDISFRSCFYRQPCTSSRIDGPKMSGGMKWTYQANSNLALLKFFTDYFLGMAQFPFVPDARSNITNHPHHHLRWKSVPSGTLLHRASMPQSVTLVPQLQSRISY